MTQKSPKIRHLGTIAQLCRAIPSHVRHASTIGKKFVKQQHLPHASHNMVIFGLLTAEIGLPVWGTPAYFNGFRVLASLLQRRRSMEAKQTLHDVWSSPALVHYIYIFGDSCPLTEFCQVQNSLRVKVLRYPTLGALLYGTRAVGVSETLRRGTRNRVTEISEKAPLIFGRAAITLGIGPHSSFFFLSSIFYFPCLFSAVTEWMSTILPHMMWP